MELAQKLTPELTSEKKEEIYKFCDMFISGIDFSPKGDYFNDDKTLHLKFVVNSEILATFVRYAHTSDSVEAEIGIKKLDKSFQLFMLIWGFCKKYSENKEGDNDSLDSYSRCDIIAGLLFKEYASNEYHFKTAMLDFIDFMGKNTNESKMNRVRNMIDRFVYKKQC